jgi:hypothetical protein
MRGFCDSTSDDREFGFQCGLDPPSIPTLISSFDSAEWSCSFEEPSAADLFTLVVAFVEEDLRCRLLDDFAAILFLGALNVSTHPMVSFLSSASFRIRSFVP